MPLEQWKVDQQPIEKEKVHSQSPTQIEIKPKITPGEKILYVLFAVFVVLFSSILLSNEGDINALNREIQVMGNDLKTIEKENAQLTVEVKEKSTYEVIWDKAKGLGLDLNENNVKVVPSR